MTAATWVGYPASYTKGRARPVQYVTLHYTAGSEGPTSAEGGAAYDKRRTDGTSTHYFTDSAGPALQEVPDGDRSHAARWHGNEIGIHIEICGTRQTRAQWLDPVSLATLRTTAALVAELCVRHKLEVRRLTAAQTRAAYYAAAGSRPTGINDHAACTAAYPEDQGDHTDVGAAFPWDVFMEMVDEAMEGDDVPTGLIGLKKGDTGTEVKGLQNLLRRAGYDPGDSGKYDDRTVKALAACRKDMGSGDPDGSSVSGDGYAQLIAAVATTIAAAHAGKPGPKGDTGPAGPKGDAAVLAPGATLTVTG